MSERSDTQTAAWQFRSIPSVLLAASFAETRTSASCRKRAVETCGLWGQIYLWYWPRFAQRLCNMGVDTIWSPGLVRELRLDYPRERGRALRGHFIFDGGDAHVDGRARAVLPARQREITSARRDLYGLLRGAAACDEPLRVARRAAPARPRAQRVGRGPRVSGRDRTRASGGLGRRGGVPEPRVPRGRAGRLPRPRVLW